MTTATYALHHDVNAEDVGGDCIPRVSLDCSACKRSVIYCHLSAATLRAYVKPTEAPWRCSDCGSAVSHAS